MQAIALKARLIFPVDAPPLRESVVTVAAGRVVSVGENTSGRPPLDLGNVALLPGLINAHTHLEFSHLKHPLGLPTVSFAQWIAAVITHRRERDAEAGDAEPWRAASVRRGLDECQQTGTIALGEIATPAVPAAAYQMGGCDCTVFLELLGLAPERAAPLLDLARQHIAAGRDPTAAWRPGLSPHAPYSVHPQLLTDVCRLSRESRVPVAMHVAETREELELLADGTGELVSLLQWLDAWQAAAIPRGTRPLDYLRELARADRALIIHGNYLDSEEVRFLAGNADRMSVVYCPRTHARFGHPQYPLAEMLARGVRVAVGTDSRASNPDLNLLAEMRFVYRHHDRVDPADVLRMGTIQAAESLGLQDRFGSIGVGKRADFTTVGLPGGRDEDPYDLLFNIPFATQRLCFAE